MCVCVCVRERERERVCCLFISVCLLCLPTCLSVCLSVCESVQVIRVHLLSGRMSVYEDVPLVEFMRLVLTRMPGEGYRR